MPSPRDPGAAPEPGAAGSSSEASFADYAGVLARRWKWVLGFTLLVPLLVAAFCMVAPKKYESKAVLVMETEDISVGTFPSELVTAGRKDLYSRAQFYTTERHLISSRTNLRPVVQNAELWGRCSIEGDDPIEALAKAMEVKGDATSKLTDVNVEHAEPQCAADLANAVSATYVRSNLDDIRSKFREDVENLAPELDRLRVDLTHSLQEGEDYKEEHGLVNLDAPGAEDMKRLAELDAAFTQAQVNRIQMEKRAQQARRYASDPARVESLPETLADPVVSKLRQSYLQLKGEQADLAQRYRDKHPKMQRVLAQIGELQKRIAEEIGRVVEALEIEHQVAIERERSIGDEVELQRQATRERSARAYQAHLFSDESAARRQLFDQVSSKVIEAKIVANIKRNNVSVVDPAEKPREPSFPDTQLYSILGLAVGLVLGLTGAFTSAALDRTIHGPREVERSGRVPLGEVIPESRNLARPGAAAAGNLAPELAEAYARVAALVEVERSRRMPSFGACQIVSATGCTGGEGVTTLVVGLARASAAAGRRVLVVDAHPEAPRLTTEVGGETKPGLVEWVQGSLTLDKVRQAGSIPGVAVLSAGSPIGAGVLIRPDRVQATFASIGSAFDLVIIDTPPLVRSAFSQVLARYSDLVLVVAQSNRTTVDQLEAVARELGQVEAVSARVALNRVT